MALLFLPIRYMALDQWGDMIGVIGMARAAAGLALCLVRLPARGPRMAHVGRRDPTPPTLPWHAKLSNVGEMPAMVPRMPPINPFC